MKALYTYTGKNEIVYIPAGGGHQRLLVWFEDNGDWFVYFCDDLRSMTYIHRIINKMKPSPDIFSGFNLEVLTTEEYDKYEKWIRDNYNYQGLHKDEKIDG